MYQSSTFLSFLAIKRGFLLDSSKPNASTVLICRTHVWEEMQRTFQKDGNVNLYNPDYEDTDIENVESRTKSGKIEIF